MPNLEIHLPDPAGTTAEFAAAELRDLLRKLPDLPPVTVTMCLDPGLMRDEFTLTGRGRYALTGGSEAALLYGVYALLHAFGFRFFGPDPWDTVVPEGRRDLPEVRERFRPRYDLRGFFAIEKRETPEFLLWMARNRLNYWTGEVHSPELCAKLGIRLRGNPPSGMHRLFADFLPPARYAAEHPGYYALHEGRRVWEMGQQTAWNICTSDPDAARVLGENVAEALQSGPLASVTSFTFAPFDNGHWCECGRCAAQGNRTTRFLLLADACSKIIRARVSRPVQLIVPAYHETLPVPDKPLPADFDYERIAVEFFPIERCYAHAFADPACRTNAMLKQCYDAWARLGNFRIFVCEYYNVSKFASAAFVFDDSIPGDLGFYAQNAACGITYMHVSTALWGELALTNCAFAAAASGMPFDEADFLTARYGRAAATMKLVYARLRRVSHLAKPFFHYLGTDRVLPETGQPERVSMESSLRRGDGELLRLEGHFEEDVSTPENPSLREAVRLLHEAQDLLAAADPAGDARVRQVLETDRMRLDYTVRRADLMVSFLELLRAENAGDRASAERCASRLREIGEAMRRDTLAVAHIRAAGAPNLALYVNTLTATQLQNLYAEKMRQYGLAVAPFSQAEGVTVHQG